MDTKDIIEKLISLNTITKNFIETNGNVNFDLESKILFFISQNEDCCPLDIIDEFRIKKTNLAIICKVLLDKDLIKKAKDTIDGRAIKYNITTKGQAKVTEFLTPLKDKIATISKQEQIDLLNNINNSIHLMKK